MKRTLVLSLVLYFLINSVSAIFNYSFSDNGPRILRHSNTSIQILPEKLNDLPPDYPFYRPLLKMLQDWNPDNPEMPEVFHDDLQHFDYMNLQDRKIAAKYRDAELPFKMYNIPSLTDTVHKWTDEYLQTEMAKLKKSNIKVDRADNNHFLYAREPVKKKNNNKKKMKNKRKLTSVITPPKEIDLTFSEWLFIASNADKNKYDFNPDKPVYYFHTLLTNEKNPTFIWNDLPMFTTKEENFFVMDTQDREGIRCRFGMRGIVSESHFDQDRNFVIIIRGKKRYILTPPNTCKFLGIINDKNHRSYRHSIIDWSDLAQAEAQNFAAVRAVESIVNEGEAIYIPSCWFHYIISMEFTAQCNARSGIAEDHLNHQDMIEFNRCLGYDPLLSRRRSRQRRKAKARAADW